jgi:hypothetical protein
MLMVHKTPHIDIEAFGALDHRRLLRVLRRAIDEETTERMSGGRTGASERDRERLQCLCTLVCMVQNTKVLELYCKQPSGRMADA